MRDWLYVEDHAKALLKVALEADIGETYNIGGHNQLSNIDLVNSLCAILDDEVECYPDGVKRFSELINFVDDRPGHDKRYAIDCSKLKKHLKNDIFLPSTPRRHYFSFFLWFYCIILIGADLTTKYFIGKNRLFFNFCPF